MGFGPLEEILERCLVAWDASVTCFPLAVRDQI